MACERSLERLLSQADRNGMAVSVNGLTRQIILSEQIRGEGPVHGFRPRARFSLNM
ncbi:hypothetical protein IMCC3135_08195 [Granulosicoccus antarcticus IMCC3135]|uniref:Uncharacterized protein n=1 Tax=Granulosicoccus antarcticus IMCC3135 TaxID=1192854 RepID=A0A2Z2NK23_9GAMM|nr:hypothetical protein IMCC3135_08195 [Granulosicoccus antarcticus IMCC3135]